MQKRNTGLAQSYKNHYCSLFILRTKLTKIAISKPVFSSQSSLLSPWEEVLDMTYVASLRIWWLELRNRKAFKGFLKHEHIQAYCVNERLSSAWHNNQHNNSKERNYFGSSLQGFPCCFSETVHHGRRAQCRKTSHTSAAQELGEYPMRVSSFFPFYSIWVPTLLDNVTHFQGGPPAPQTILFGNWFANTQGWTLLNLSIQSSWQPMHHKSTWHQKTCSASKVLSPSHNVRG